MELLLAVVGFSVVGTIAGTVTGLIPGIHVNTIAAWAIAAHISLASLISTWSGISPSDGLILLGVFLASAMISHEFMEIIPSVFLGAPDPDSSLTVYPGHRMLRRGLGYKAIVSSASGTVIGALFALVLIVPLRILMGPPLDGYKILEPAIPYILITIALVLIMGQKKTNFSEGWSARVIAFGVFMLAGVFGVITLNANLPYIPEEHILVPIFTGLFGVSTLLFSLHGKDNDIPTQKTSPLREMIHSMKPRTGRMGKTFISSLSGALVSFFPGVTGAQATSVANILTRGDASEPESYIHHLSVIRISAAIFSIMALFTILRGRSGVAVAISHIVPSIELWMTITEPPVVLILILLSMVLAVLFSFFILIFIGLFVARNIHKIRPKPLAITVISFLIVLVFLFTGVFGVVILAAGTCIGLLAQTLGVSRVHLMGVLILPVIIYYFAG